MKEKIIIIAQEIPYGHVTSYGRVAELLDAHYDIKTSGRMVGKVMNTILKGEGSGHLIPRRRVVNKQGYISTNKLGHVGRMQKNLLEREGIQVMNDTVDMKKYGWEV